MKRYQSIFLAMLFLSAMDLQAYAQTVWTKGVDTFKITEGEVADSTIITVLDSAFTFLRLPSLDSGLPYYYGLYITKSKDTLLKNTLDINLYVDNYFITDQLGMEWFNERDKLLFNYKGAQVLVYYDLKTNDTLALKYFKPTSKKGNFYFSYKRSKNEPHILAEPDIWYQQRVRFLIKKKHIIFRGYTLNIDEAEAFKVH